MTNRHTFDNILADIVLCNYYVIQDGRQDVSVLEALQYQALVMYNHVNSSSPGTAYMR